MDSCFYTNYFFISIHSYINYIWPSTIHFHNYYYYYSFFFNSSFSFSFCFVFCLNREGAANEELIDYMSHVLGVKTKCIQLDVGTKSRNKILLINFGTTTNNKQQQQQQQPTITTAEKVLKMLKEDMDR